MNGLLDSFPQLVPITTQAQWDVLKARAAEDNHGLLLPTHMILKGDQPAGFFGIQSLPFVPCWFSTKLLKARDSLQMINVVNNMVAMGGAPAIAYPVQEHSPFFPHMEKMGFRDHGAFHLFIKELKKGA